MNMTPYLMNVILTGNKILDSTLGQGLQKLFTDGLEAAQIIGVIIIGLVLIIVSLKKSHEEEQERKRYTKWQLGLVAIAVIIVMAQDLIDLVLSYFKG